MIEPEEKKAVPESDTPTDHRKQLDRRCGVIDRRIKPDRRASITDDITDYRIREIEGVKAKRKWYEKIFPSIFDD